MTVVMHRNRINKFLRDPAGPVGLGLDYLGARVQAKARGKCPVETGTLMRSIRATPVRQVGPSRLNIQIGSNVYYAIYVHNGTEDMEARPFLKDALDQEVR